MQAEEADAGIPPTFTEKPKIVPNETGTLVTMIFRVRRTLLQCFCLRNIHKINLIKSENFFDVLPTSNASVFLGTSETESGDAVVQRESQDQGGGEVHQQVHRAEQLGIRGPPGNKRKTASPYFT